MTNYRDIQVPPSFGYPELVFADRNTAIISDWRGCCRTVQLDSGQVTTSPSFANTLIPCGGELTSLRIDPSNRNRCAVATRSGWAGLWQLGNTEVVKINSKAEDGSVWAVGFSDDGRFLALGVGLYPLNPAHQGAAWVEIWAVEDEPRHLACVAVPGVCVDWMGWAWHEADYRWIVLSGRRKQDGGYLTQLDGENLRSVRITELDSYMTRNCHLVERAKAIMISQEETLTLRELDSPKIPIWQWSSEDEQYRIKKKGIRSNDIRTCIDTDQNVIFTNCGELVNLDSGNLVDRLPVPEGCQEVATRPGGGFVALATGVMRIYAETM